MTDISRSLGRIVFLLHSLPKRFQRVRILLDFRGRSISLRQQVSFFFLFFPLLSLYDV